MNESLFVSSASSAKNVPNTAFEKQISRTFMSIQLQPFDWFQGSSRLDPNRSTLYREKYIPTSRNIHANKSTRSMKIRLDMHIGFKLYITC